MVRNTPGPARRTRPGCVSDIQLSRSRCAVPLAEEHQRRGLLGVGATPWNLTTVCDAARRSANRSIRDRNFACTSGFVRSLRTSRGRAVIRRSHPVPMSQYHPNRDRITTASMPARCAHLSNPSERKNFRASAPTTSPRLASITAWRTTAAAIFVAGLSMAHLSGVITSQNKCPVEV